MSFFEELKRRNVFKVGVAYLVGSWLLLQMSDILVPILGLPDSAQRFIFLLLVTGFIPALIFAWVFELTPEGLKKEKDIDRTDSIAVQTGSRLNIAIICMLVVALAYFIWEARFAVDKPAETAASGPGVAQPSAAAVSEKSVAVLPFVNMSSDPEQEYFSDGLSEELLNRLAQNSRLQVAARTSSFQFKGQNQDVGEIGRQLKVDNVLEGSVRKSGNRLRITAQLIRVDSGFHLWSETYEREMDDIFAIQDEIAQAISNALEAELGTSPTSADAHPTENLEAYQAYLQARFLLAKRGEANMLEAHALFEKTVSLDPNYSKAWSSLAYNYALLPYYGTTVSVQQAWEKVSLAANRAIQLDPGNAEAHAALAFSNYQDDFKSILQTYERAYELDPNSADVLNFYADFLSKIGDFTASERIQNRAIEVDPLGAVHYSDMAFLMFILNRNEEALDYGRTSARLEPDTIDRIDPLIIGLIQNDLQDEAIQMITRFEKLPGTDAATDWWWCMLEYRRGNVAKLRERIASILTKIGTGQDYWLNYTNLALFTAWADGVDAALPLLEEAYANNDPNLYWPGYFYLPEDISDDPGWLAFWEQPRLAELMEMRRSKKPIGPVGYWKERTAQ